MCGFVRQDLYCVLKKQCCRGGNCVHPKEHDFVLETVTSQPVLSWSSERKESIGLKIPQSLISNDFGKKKWVKDSGKYLCYVPAFLLLLTYRMTFLSTSRNALDVFQDHKVVRMVEMYESCLYTELPLLFSLSVKETQQLPLGKFHVNLILK